MARPGAFTLAPSASMREALARDYAAMAGMVFGEVPAFDALLDAAGHLERAINEAAP